MNEEILQTCKDIYHEERIAGKVFGMKGYSESAFLSATSYQLLSSAKTRLINNKKYFKKRDYDDLVDEVKEFLKERGAFESWRIAAASMGYFNQVFTLRTFFEERKLFQPFGRNDELEEIIKLEEITRFTIEHFYDCLNYQEKYKCQIKTLEEIKQRIKENLETLFHYYNDHIEVKINEDKSEEIIFKFSEGEHKKESKSKKRNSTFQNNFKDNVEMIMQKCPITGMEFDLEHCHIMPYNCDESSNEDRQNGYNGFLFYYPLHKMFDDGKFTFLNDGTLIISKTMTRFERDLWSDFLKNKVQYDIKNYGGKRDKYLNYHRRQVFKGVDEDEEI